MKLRHVLLAVPALALTACESEAPPPPAPTPSAPVEAAPAPKSKVNNGCVGPIADGEAKAVKTGALEWEQKGSTLTLKSKLDGKLVFGVISDVKEDTEENKANVAAFLEHFKKSKVNAIIVAGDTGVDKAQIGNVLTLVAGAGLPVFTIIGNREGQKDYADAVAEVAAKAPLLVDLNTIRRIDLPQLDIISMPGYHDHSYVHAEDGCAYEAADVAKLDALVKAANSPVLLVSHGGPRMGGAEGVDRTAEGGNVGDPALAKLIADNKIPFGVFGNIHEAGGRGTDIDGNGILPAGKPHDALYVNPGPADGVRWAMNDKSISFGMAATLTIDGGKASYEVFRMPDPDAPQAKGKGKGKGK